MACTKHNLLKSITSHETQNKRKEEITSKVLNIILERSKNKSGVMTDNANVQKCHHMIISDILKWHVCSYSL